MNTPINQIIENARQIKKSRDLNLKTEFKQWSGNIDMILNSMDFNSEMNCGIFEKYKTTFIFENSFEKNKKYTYRYVIEIQLRKYSLNFKITSKINTINNIVVDMPKSEDILTIKLKDKNANEKIINFLEKFFNREDIISKFRRFDLI
jgi:hypothetical protein